MVVRWYELLTAGYKRMKRDNGNEDQMVFFHGSQLARKILKYEESAFFLAKLTHQ